MATINPAQFVREVRQEMTKVTWPSRHETMVSTAMVVMLAAITAIFFITVDWVAGSAVRYILGIGA